MKETICALILFSGALLLLFAFLSGDPILLKKLFFGKTLLIEGAQFSNSKYMYLIDVIIASSGLVMTINILLVISHVHLVKRLTGGQRTPSDQLWALNL